MIAGLLALLAFSPDRARVEETLRICATSDTSHSALATEATATGLSWTPAPSSVYRIKADIIHTAAATTTGMQGRLDPGNATTGACYGVVRNTSATTASVYTGSVGTTITTNDVLGASTATTFTRLQYECVVETTSSPTAVAFKFHTEVDTSAVTVKANLSCLDIVKIR